MTSLFWASLRPPPTGLGRGFGVVVNNAGRYVDTVFIGDSWIGGYSNPPYSGYYAGAYVAAHPEHPVTNLARGGQGLGYIRSLVSTIITMNPYVIVIDTGRNDFMNGDIYGTPIQSPDDNVVFLGYVSYLQSIINDLKAALPGVQIVLNTLLQWNNDANTGTSSYEVRYNANRARYNTLVRAWRSSGYIAAVFDFAADPTLSNTTIYPDNGIHLLDIGTAGSGHTIAAPIFAATMNALYPPTPVPTEDVVSTYSIMPFTVPSQNEGNTGSTAYSTMIVRSGAIGQAGTVDWAVTGTSAHPANAADFVGGVLPSGTQAFAAGDTGKNITINVQGDTVAENDEQFTITLSNPKVTGLIGTATTTATIVNDDGTVTTVTYVVGSGQVSGSFPGTPCTFSGNTLGAGFLNLFIFADYGRAITGVIARKSGQSDVTLTLQNGLWCGDIPVAASDWQIIITDATDSPVLYAILPLTVIGANETMLQPENITITAGNTSPFTGTVTYSIPTNGAVFNWGFFQGSTSAPLTITRTDSATQLASYVFTDFDGQKCTIHLDLMTANGHNSYVTSPTNPSTPVRLLGVGYNPGP